MNVELLSEPTGPPRIVVACWHAPPAEAPWPPFAPLRPPDNVRITLGGPLTDAISHGHLAATVTLRGGRHRLQLNPRDALEFEVAAEGPTAAGPQAQLVCEIAQTRPDQASYLRLAELSFAPSIRLHRLLHLVEDMLGVTEPRLQILRQLVSAYLPRDVPAHLRERLRSMDDALTVSLRRVRLEAPRGAVTRATQLSLAVTGAIELGDRLTLPFENLLLPVWLPLPPLPAFLSQLLSLPRVTVPRPHPLPPWAEGLLTLMAQLSGSATAGLVPPPIRLQQTATDGVVREADISLAPAHATLEFSVRAVDGAIEVDRCQASWRDQTAEVGCQISARARWPVASLALRPRRQRSPKKRVTSAERPVLRVTFAGALPDMAAQLRQQHPLCRGEWVMPLVAKQPTIAGGFELRLRPPALRSLHPLQLRTSLDLLEGAEYSVGHLRGLTTGQLDAHLQLRAARHGLLHLSGKFKGTVTANVAAQLLALPELNLHHGRLEGCARVRLEAFLGARLMQQEGVWTQMDLSGSALSLSAEHAALTLDRRELTLPAQSRFKVRLEQLAISPAGFSPARLAVSWRFPRQSPRLCFAQRTMALLPKGFLRGGFAVRISESGHWAVDQGEGDDRLLWALNLILRPTEHFAEGMALFRNRVALAPILDVLQIFSPEVSEKLAALSSLIERIAQQLADEKIRVVGDVLPRPVLARVLSRLLAGDDGLVAELTPILKQATEGRGLPMVRCKQLLLHHLGVLDIDYELAYAIKVLDLLFRAERLPRLSMRPKQTPPHRDPPVASGGADEPSADALYQTLATKQDDRAFGEQVAALAPALTLAQLHYLLAQANAAWGSEALRRLRYVAALKERVAQIRKSYGGLDHAPQTHVIASFLGEALGPLPAIDQGVAPAAGWSCALGPDDVATLLQANLAINRHNRRVQLNKRLLLELLAARPPAFTHAVLIELSEQSPHALAGILYALLDQDQDQLRSPLDVAGRLQQLLGMAIPDQGHFLAGGKQARASYYQALNDVARDILDTGDDYLARRARLQMATQRARRAVPRGRTVGQLATRAKQAIARADQQGKQCRFVPECSGPLAAAQAAYQEAFAACAALWAQEPRAFQLPWFKRFWQRNEEALRVVSAVRNVQGDIERTRHWLTVRSGAPPPADEQTLVDAIIPALYALPQEQAALARDPLVRLLLEPAPCHYEMTLVSCMGVVTEGRRGDELQGPYQRLAQRYGVQIVRADTGLGRSLEYNAERIIAAIACCSTPWGIVGYSQGCANALLAESMLYRGTPLQQQALDGLRGRNLLFSSLNGSAHGTSGMKKFLASMVLGEQFLKHYQALYSRETTRAVLRALRTLLDSPFLIHLLGGTHSLSFERAEALHRDLQIRDTVPTSTTRALVTPDRLPEALELMYHLQSRLTGSDQHDTQVLLSDAVGHSTRVQSDWMTVLAHCEMDSFVQATHHWAPITETVAFVTTARDRARAVYDSPRDQLIWPWIEVQARFGHIKRLAQRAAD